MSEREGGGEFEILKHLRRKKVQVERKQYVLNSLPLGSPCSPLGGVRHGSRKLSDRRQSVTVPRSLKFVPSMVRRVPPCKIHAQYIHTGSTGTDWEEKCTIGL